MKKTVLLIMVCILMQSCNSKEKDLAQITFTEKYDTFFGDIPNVLDKDYSIVDAQLYNSYKSESEKTLYFNGVDLSGYRDEKGSFGTNNVRFEFSKNDSVLNFYYLTLYTQEKVKKLIENINNKIGKPVYISTLLSNPENSKPDALLWADKTSFYLLTGATQNQSDFVVFNKKNITIREQWLSGPFQYYENYLEKLEQKKLKKEAYSYKNFIDEMAKEGRKLYLEKYIKP
ncbi:hypothetical protein FNW52_10290 [Flavobacterium sp. ZT3R18]|uniref:hypothetical protein n=1 Tax=Flavobacterium sp. ZT3R18 TaxID=2594429 RepID=UPI00117AFE90|nr:hypothetical protein [Flavobacterium sp. ZT3R18]TRX35868.1 hypothetical protein FNW52_10290 [Flavobacterium sp. ZT3R18]